MKTAIITGAYGVIGREIAKGLAGENYEILLLGRDRNRLEELQKNLESYCGIKPKNFVIDVSNKKEIFDLANTLTGPLDVLINNAAFAPRERKITKDGIEVQWATNVMSYYWMITAFENHLRKSLEGRIVNVASNWAGGLDLDDPEFTHRMYNNNQAYRQAKQANRMLTYGFSELFQGGISINACHPGDANSNLSNDLGFGGSMSGRQAAATPLYLAIDSKMDHMTGGYYVSCRAVNCQFKNDVSEINKLMQLCAGY